MSGRGRRSIQVFLGVAVLSFAAWALLGYHKSRGMGNSQSITTRMIQGEILAGEDAEMSPSILQSPLGLSVADATGNLYVADYKANKVVVLDPSGRQLGTIGRTGQGPGELLNPVDVDIAAGKLYVLEAGNFRVSIYDLNGVFLRSFRTGPVSADQRIAVSRDGNRIYLNEPTPTSGSLFTVYSPEGKVLHRFGNLMEPKWGARKFEMNTVCFDLGGDEELVVFYRYAPIVQRYSRDGHLLYSGELNIPEVPQKRRDQKELLKENPEGALVTYVDDVYVTPQGQVYIVVPPSREILKREEGSTTIVYELDPSFRPKNRYLWKVPHPLMQSYFDAFCMSNSGSAFGTMRWAAALAKVDVQKLGSGLE